MPSDFLCGIPIRNGQDVSGALVAFGRDAYRSPGHEAGKYARDYHAVEMEKFLGSLTTLIEENMSKQEEIEDMVQELDQSFEDLYLYGQIASQIKTIRFSTDMLESLIEKLIENMRVDAAFAIMPKRPELNIWYVKPDVSDAMASPDKLFQKTYPPDTT